MTTGTIKFFNAGKGFGFVTPDGGGADIFLPAAALTAGGIPTVKPGQRVTFEQAADKKGPKVVTLQLLGETAVKAPAPAPERDRERVTVYCDPGADVVADILGAIRAAGYEMQLLDYVAAPLSQEQLRVLSHLLSGSGKSLVRRHDPLFSGLQLDDRFIGDQEFWTAIAEHPALINGPVLVFSGKARICKTLEDAKNFLNRRDEAIPAKPKTLSPRLAALIKGEPLPALPKAEAKAPELPPQPVKPAAAPPSVEAAVKPKRKVAAKPPAAKVEKKKAPPKTAKKPVKKTKK
jgi:CspA family cold shock protein